MTLNQQRDDFWRTKTLDEMDHQEWESLCDGCGKCCVIQLENEETNQLFYTDVACQLLDISLCRCQSYSNRQEIVPSCMMLTKDNVRQCAEFAPETCAYRLLVEGKDLYPWHPLISGDKNSVHEAGISVKGKVISEKNIDSNALEDRIIDF